jgi:hypothetical protein
MSRSVSALLIALACGTSRMALPAELHPEDFSYAMPIETRGDGTAYRFTVPVEVFMKVVHEDLRDLRVFNARGGVVPYELRRAAAEPMTRRAGPSLPLFPLHGEAHASLNGVRVTIRSEGTAVDLQTAGAGSDPHVITSYLIDAREFPEPLSGLQLQWASGAPEFSGSVRIESSDDLASWHVVKSDAPVVHLFTGGSELNQSLLEFSSTRAKFWKLTWVGKTAPFELTAVTPEGALSQPSTPQSTVTVGGSRVAKKENELIFDLGARLPVRRVNLLLPESNSVLSVELLSRARTTDPWRPVAQGEFYRVSAGASERSNEPIRIPTDADPLWLARQTQPTAPLSDVKLQVAWDTVDLVFLARGSGPFVLAYGSASAGPADVALEQFIKGVTVLPAETGHSYLLGGTERLRPQPKPIAWRMAALWSALGLGVLVLAWMAFRLSKELESGPRH